MGLPSHQHQNPNTIPSHQHRIQVPSHPISTRLPLPSHPIYTRRRLPSHTINAFLRVSHPIPSHQCISSCFPSHRITIIKESDSHPIFVMVKLKKNPACAGLSDGIPSHVVPSAPRIALVIIRSFVCDTTRSRGLVKETQCYYHRRTRLNAMERFCVCSL